MVRLQVLHVHGPPTRVGARGRRNPGQLVELELVEALLEVLVVLDLVGEQDEQRTWGFESVAVMMMIETRMRIKLMRMNTMTMKMRSENYNDQRTKMRSEN